MSTEQSQAGSHPKLSHELRTPLNHIIGYSEMLIEEAEDADNTSCVARLQEIRRMGKHLLTLVNEIFSADRARARETYLKTMLDALIPPANTVTAHVTALLKEGADNKTLVEDLQKIQAAVDRLLDLVKHAEEYAVPGTPNSTPQAASTSKVIRAQKEKV